MPILKKVGSILAGLLVAVVVMSAIQFANYQLFPPPTRLDPENPEHLAQIMGQMPLLAFFMLELSYAIGSFLGGFTLGKLAPENPRLSWVLGAVLTLAGVANLFAIPHPVWVAVMTTVTYLPLARLGFHSGTRGGATPG
jgi:hypothetical protein